MVHEDLVRPTKHVTILVIAVSGSGPHPNDTSKMLGALQHGSLYVYIYI